MRNEHMTQIVRAQGGCGRIILGGSHVCIRNAGHDPCEACQGIAPMRSLNDYRPQHDDECEATACGDCGYTIGCHLGDYDKGHIYVARDCTCGLQALLAVETPQEKKEDARLVEPQQGISGPDLRGDDRDDDHGKICPQDGGVCWEPWCDVAACQRRADAAGNEPHSVNELTCADCGKVFTDILEAHYHEDGDYCDDCMQKLRARTVPRQEQAVAPSASASAQTLPPKPLRPSVEEAKTRLVLEIRGCISAVRCDSSTPVGDCSFLIDALIAAVRAEAAQEIEQQENYLSDAEIEGIRASVEDLKAGRIISLETLDWKARAEAAEAELAAVTAQCASAERALNAEFTAFPHTCQDEHDLIKWRGDGELCPVCVWKSRAETAEAQLAARRPKTEGLSCLLERCGWPDCACGYKGAANHQALQPQPARWTDTDATGTILPLPAAQEMQRRYVARGGGLNEGAIITAALAESLYPRAEFLRDQAKKTL